MISGTVKNILQEAKSKIIKNFKLKKNQDKKNTLFYKINKQVYKNE